MLRNFILYFNKHLTKEALWPNTKLSFYQNFTYKILLRKIILAWLTRAPLCIVFIRCRFFILIALQLQYASTCFNFSYSSLIYTFRCSLIILDRDSLREHMSWMRTELILCREWTWRLVHDTTQKLCQRKISRKKNIDRDTPCRTQLW